MFAQCLQWHGFIWPSVFGAFLSSVVGQTFATCATYMVCTGVLGPVYNLGALRDRRVGQSTKVTWRLSSNPLSQSARFVHLVASSTGAVPGTAVV